MKLRQLLPFIVFAFFSHTISLAQSKLYINHARRGATVAETMYGIFFEEISHAGDGGLYGELIQNRGFEEHVLPSGTTYSNGRAYAPNKPDYTSGKYHNYNIGWNTEALKYTAWTFTKMECDGTMKVVDGTPLHKNTPHSMEIRLTDVKENGRAYLQNSGYWGVPVKKDEKYKLRFYLRSSDYNGKVVAKVIRGINTLAEQEFEVQSNGEWKEYTTVLTSSGTNSQAVFRLEFNSIGTLWVDYVSLFPENTYKKRENGMRADISQVLADLKPAFLRWPGGCVVEGMTMENRIKWKETLGDPMARRGEYMRWGYRATLGFGYHEFLQFCEDIGAAGMFVANVGVSCQFNNGDYIAETELPGIIQEIRDAIEYAIGDVNTEWGAKRVAAGHPSPFPLEYVELGNENWGPIYIKYYNECYKVLKAEYPDITFISTLGIEMDVDKLAGVDMVDPHQYRTADFFYKNTFMHDGVQRGKYDVYVGEYACNQGVGTGNMEAALSEAAFISGMERNSDLIKLTSYAPLIENSNRSNWSTNLIWLNSDKVIGRSSYYVQKMFAHHRPDYNLSTRLIPQDMKPMVQGRIGLGTWLTTAEYKDFKITSCDGSRIFYEADFVNKLSDWNPFSGTWRVFDGCYRETVSAKRCISMMDQWMYNDCTIEVKARKLNGAEGFLIVFGGGKDELDSHYQLNIGGWNNTRAAIEKVTDGVGTTIGGPASFKVDNNRWYTIKLVISDGHKLDCYVDGKHVVGYHGNMTGRLQAISGYDRTNGETVIKVINGLGEEQKMNIILNADNVKEKGTVITLAAQSLSDENSFTNPELIIPVETSYSAFSDNFNYIFKPNSFTILRIKTDEDVTSDLNITVPYTDEPIKIYPTGINDNAKEQEVFFYRAGHGGWMISSNMQEIKKLVLSDSNGRTVLSENAIENKSYLLDTSNFIPGIYLAEVYTVHNSKIVRKLVVD